MMEPAKILAIMDLVLGVSVLLDGVVCIIWTFDTVFQLALLIIGGYMIFFGACVVLLSLKGMALVDTYAPFMNTNAGKLFAYTFLLGLTISIIDASWFAIILMIFVIIVDLAYIPLTFVPAYKDYKAGHLLGGGPAQQDDKTQANPAHSGPPPAAAPAVPPATQL